MSEEEKIADPWLQHRNSIPPHSSIFICPIWGAKYKDSCIGVIDGSRQRTKFWSPRAGGAFMLSHELMGDHLLGDNENTLKLNEKIAFSRWVYEENRQSRIPEIFTDEQFKKIVEAQKIPIEDKMYRLLESLAELPAKPAEGIGCGEFAVKDQYGSKYLLLANCELTDDTEFEWLINAAKLKNELERYNSSMGSRLRLTPKGLSELSTTKRKIQSEQAFIAMWFDDSMESVRENALRPAIEAAGYRPYFVDEDKSYSNDQITNKILAKIKSSKCLIADFTHGEKGARGGVYFEAGYALALGIPVIWLIKKDDISKMHFDTDHYPHIKWTDEAHLKEELKDALLAHQHIGKGPLTPSN